MSKKRKYLVIHCSAEPNDRKTTGKDILRWHTDPKPKGNGWSRPGYEAVIARDGSIEYLMEDDGDEFVDGFEVTNGARGFNSVSRHVCLIGGLTSDGKKDLEMNTEMHDALVGYVKDKLLKEPELKIAGHYHLSHKSCPNFDVVDWCRSIGVAESNIQVEEIV